MTDGDREREKARERDRAVSEALRITADALVKLSDRLRTLETTVERFASVVNRRDVQLRRALADCEESLLILGALFEDAHPQPN